MNLFKKHKTFESILQDFLAEKEMSVSHRTMYGYRTHTKDFLVWLKENNYSELSINKITNEIVSKFFLYIGTVKKLDKTTCEKYFLNIRGLFKYAQKREMLDKVPFDLVVLPQKKESRSADVIRPEHIAQLLDLIKKEDKQLYLFCMIEYYCFIRPGRELRQMKVGDIDLDNGVITVIQDHAKNHKRQLVTIPKQLIDICREYGIDKADKDLYIFGLKGKMARKPISVNNMSTRFDVFRDRLSLPKTYKLYSWKHTGATKLHISGISMRELMDQLRHTRLTATEHYLRLRSGTINERIRDKFPSPI